MSYDAQRTAAYNAIKAKGAAMVLKRAEGGEYNPSTCTTSPATVFEYPCYGLIEEYSTSAIDGTLVLVGDKKLTVTAADDFPDPDTADALVIGNEIYKVVRCKPLAPNGLSILYEVQARK